MSKALLESAVQFETSIEEADAILLAAARDERELYPDERWALRKLLGLDNDQIDNELNRVRRVHHIQQVHGTAADRAELRKKRDLAEKKLNAQGDQLAEKIRELQAKLNQMERECKTLTRRCDDADSAEKLLRHLIPPAVQDEINFRRRSLNRSLRADLHIKQQNLECCRQLLEYAKNPSQHVEQIRTLDRHFKRRLVVQQITETAGGKHARYAVVPDALNEFVSELQAKWPEMKAEVEAMQADYDEQLAEINKLTEFYLN